MAFFWFWFTWAEEEFCQESVHCAEKTYWPGCGAALSDISDLYPENVYVKDLCPCTCPQEAAMA